jgi:altronate dehydratase small subunit
MADTKSATPQFTLDGSIDAIMIADSDNVATCLRDIESGTQVTVMLGKDTRVVTATDSIPRGHKLAVRDIAEGESVRKYGEVIGKASLTIDKGRHAHTHNVVD